MSFNTPTIDTHIASIFDKLEKNSLVLDLGTSKRFAKEIASYQSILEKNNYYALGYQPEKLFGQDSCDLSGDILQLPFKTSIADLVICIEVIEHVKNPFEAIAEIYRVTKPGGVVILTTPFLTAYHGKGTDTSDFSHASYPDFWRFTFQGLETLFADFSTVEVIPFSNTYQYLYRVITHSLGLKILCNPLVLNLLEKVQKLEVGVTTHRHLVIAKK